MTEAAPPAAARPRPVVLCILDGLGERADAAGNAVQRARTPHLDALAAAGPKTTLAASGADVGLAPGQRGTGAAGHRTLGAGRILPSDAAPIDAAIAAKKLHANEVIDRTFRIAKDWGCRLHLFGLVSDAGVHASLAHFHALFELARFHEVKLVLHAFLDGRDAPPKSAWDHLQKLEASLQGAGVIGTVSGRAYAMDTSGRWDRVQQVYTAIVRGEAPRAGSVFEAIHASYLAGRTDEHVEPVRIGEYEGMAGSFMADFAAKSPVWEWWGEEVGLAVNFRQDGLRALSAMFARRNIPPEVEEFLTDRNKPVRAFQEWCQNNMVDYDPSLKLPVAYPREIVADTLGEVASRAGLRQLRCAETVKQAHVTTFFDGGREEPFPGEAWRIVPSDPEGAAKNPEMRSAEVAAEVVEAIRSGAWDLVVVNLAGPDAAGHTGSLDAAARAVEAADAAVGAIAAAVRDAGGAMIVTSDHGNCEQMAAGVEGAGAEEPSPAHTASPVPLWLAGGPAGAALRSGGGLRDVAPTLLDLLGLPPPEAMTGRSLLSPN